MENQKAPEPSTWKLNVQGVVVPFHHPSVIAREAIKLAGFDPDAGWIIVLKVAGEKRREIDLTSKIDLTHPGIEKLRLTPKQINNGEATQPRRRDFALLPKDDEHLARLGIRWETAFEGGRRWLLLPDYPVPTGYAVNTVSVAIEIPSVYPGAQLDMFYCYPALALRSGAVIPQTQHTEAIFGRAYQRWSRHREWDCARDSLATHLALVDESFLRETES